MLNSDKTFTTGNDNEMNNLDVLLPYFDPPVINLEARDKAIKHHQFLNNFFEIFNPDFFAEDPKMFLGDHDTYFKIVKKRSIVFYYISRVILYIFLVVIVWSLLESAISTKVHITHETYSEYKKNCFLFF